MKLFIFFYIIFEIIFRLIFYLKKKKFLFFYPIFKPKALFFKQHPYCFYVKKNNNKIKFISNNYGFAGNKDIELKKEKNIIRIYFAGNSTMENLQDDHDPNSHWPQLLVNKLSKKFKDIRFECLNAGCAGYTSAESLTDFAFRGLDFKPDLLLINQNINDAWSIQMIDGFKSDYSHARIIKTFNTFFNYVPSMRISFLYEYIRIKFINFFVKPGLMYSISNLPWKLNNKKSLNQIIAYERNIRNLVILSKAWKCKPIIIKQEVNLKNMKIPFSFIGKEKDKRSLLEYYVTTNNKSAQKVAALEDCSFYEVEKLSQECFKEDGVHFTSLGLEKFASHLFEFVKNDVENILKDRK